MIRESVIKIFQRIGVDKETYLILRYQKREQKKSMAEIVKLLVKEKYGNETLSKMSRK